MKILIVRHAPAKNRLKWAQESEDDSFRPLTKKGKRQMREAAEGLRRIVPHVDKILSSPYMRASQTAEILREAYWSEEVEFCTSLVPYAEPREFVARCEDEDPNATILIVGHEPHLSSLLAHLTTGQQPPYMYFRKGGAALVSCDIVPEARGCELHWLLTRSILIEHTRPSS